MTAPVSPSAPRFGAASPSPSSDEAADTACGGSLSHPGEAGRPAGRGRHVARKAATPPQGRLPNLILVGVSRAGTTSLFNYLRQHPDVGTSDVKELRYFTPVRHAEPLGPIEPYAMQFAACSQAFAMEATPGYFYGGRRLATVMRQTLPSVRALVSLRNPVDRCWSWFRFVKSRNRIPKDLGFSDYLDRCEQLRRQGVDANVEHQPFWGLGGGCYAQWLVGWLDAFGGDFRISFFEDLKEDPSVSVKGHCRWLGINEDDVDTFDFAATNESQLYKNRTIQKAAVRLNRRGERFFRRHPALKHSMRKAYYAVNKAPSLPQMSDAERSRLTHFYAPYNAELSLRLADLGLEIPRQW